jgi:hypothetical protein
MGGNGSSLQDVDMQIKSSNIRVPFFELPLEVYFLYWLGATGNAQSRHLGSLSSTTEEPTAPLDEEDYRITLSMRSCRPELSAGQR